jgi:hypothetical protein
MGNTAFSENVRSRRVKEAITLAEGRDAMTNVNQGGELGVVCISYHNHGTFYELCPPSDKPHPLSQAEAVPFHAWCVVAYD